MFPIHFADPTESAVAWVEAGRPPFAEMVPTFTRNVVAAHLTLYGELRLTPRHVEVIVVDGVESPLGESLEGWRDDDASLNPAKPGDEALSLSLAYDVDPDVASRIREAINACGRNSALCKSPGEDEVRCLRVDAALLAVWSAWCVELSAEGGELVGKEDFGGDAVYRMPDGRLLAVGRGAGWTRETVPVTVRGGKVSRVCWSGRGPNNFPITISAKLPDYEAPDHGARLETLRRRLEEARARAESEPLMPEMPAQRKSYDRAALPQRLPATLKLGHSSGTLRSQDAVDRRYNCEVELAAALGYRRVGREYRSGTGRSRSSEWALQGQGDIASLVPEATRIDAARGELYVPKRLVGLVIGRGGERARDIERATGRRWRVIGC